MKRRDFLIWLPVAIVSFIAIAGNLLSKLWNYVIGPKLTAEQEAKLIEKRIQNLERTVSLEKLRYIICRL